MRLTTLCYVEKDGCYLMLHRTRKEQDENAGKWIGIGGHLEENESPEECIRREAFEEAGVRLTDLRLRGIITFILPDWGNEMTFLYTAQTDTSELPECREGVLRWIPFGEIPALNLWEGDRVFLKLLADGEPFFSLKLVYDGEGKLLQSILNGRAL